MVCRIGAGGGGRGRGGLVSVVVARHDLIAWQWRGDAPTAWPGELHRCGDDTPPLVVLDLLGHGGRGTVGIVRRCHALCQPPYREIGGAPGAQDGGVISVLHVGVGATGAGAAGVDHRRGVLDTAHAPQQIIIGAQSARARNIAEHMSIAIVAVAVRASVGVAHGRHASQVIIGGAGNDAGAGLPGLGREIGGDHGDRLVQRVVLGRLLHDDIAA